MKRSPKIALAAAFGLVVLLLAPSIMDLIRGPSGAAGEGQGAKLVLPGEKTSAREEGEKVREASARKQDELLKRLQAASHPPTDIPELLRLIPELDTAGLLLGDAVKPVYESIIGGFSADDLAKLAAAWPTGGEHDTKYEGEFLAITRVLRARNDPAQLLAVLNALPANHRFRPKMIFKAVQGMEMFKPDQLSAYLGQLQPTDREALAEGLVVRVTSSTRDKEENLDLIQEYLNLGLDPAISTPLLKKHFEWTAKNDPMPALEWVKKQEPEVAKGLDEPIVRSLIAEHFEEATNYVNAIIASGDVERSQKALEVMANEYGDSDPMAAWEWVTSLPKTPPLTEQMFVDPFIALRRTDPKRAEELMNAEKDPARKELLTRIWKIAE